MKTPIRIIRHDDTKMIIQYNFSLNNENISDVWYDCATDFINGFSEVYLMENGWNFLDTTGKLLSPNVWYDKIRSFEFGFARVYLKGQGWNYIDGKGNVICPLLWFNKAKAFNGEYAIVKMNGKFFNINRSGEILPYDKNRGA